MSQQDSFDRAVRQALIGTAGDQVPADLVATVVAASTMHPQRRGWRLRLYRARPHGARFASVVALAAVLVVAAIGVAPVLRGSANPGAVSSRIVADGLSFAIPSGWHATQMNLELHYETVLAYVGTGDGSMSCGADYIPGLGGTCTQTLNLSANSIVVKVSSWGGPPAPNGVVNQILASYPGASPVVIGDTTGVLVTIPVAQAYAPDGADTVLEWTFQRPGGNPDRRYTVVAYEKGPDVTSVQSQLSALLASVTTGN
jgi:hypothetical protein